MQTLTIATSVHGRYLYEERGAERLLAGFHGYGEDAATHLAELEKIPGIERWSVVAIQALHPFYTRSGAIVGNWMTSQDRELAIADNIAYVRAVLGALPPPKTLVFAGFSQGATMAARAAAFAGPAAGLIMLGGDVPQDVEEAELPPTLLARGTRDDWYTDEKFKKNLSFWESRTRITQCVFEGGHEWSDEFRTAAGEFLERMERA
jgi:predicted esterase